MIALDFKDWHAYHQSLFPSVTGWMSKLPQVTGPNGEPSQQAITAAWARILSDVDLKFAKQASDLLAKGQEEFHDRSFDCHPRTVRTIAMKLAGTQRRAQAAQQRSLDGEELFDCGFCRDTGIVEVYVPKFLEWAVDAFADVPPPPAGQRLSWQRHPLLKERPTGLPFSCAIACTCSRGGPKQKGLRGYVFNAERHIPYDPFKFWESLEKMRGLLATRGGF